MKIILALLCASVLSAEGTVSCVGCSTYAIPGTSYTVNFGARMVWTVSGLEPTAPHLIALTFVEPTYKTAGQRPLNVAAGNYPILTAFDVFAAAGFAAPLKMAMVVSSDEQGRIVLVFTANSTMSAGRPVPHTAIVSDISAARLGGASGASIPGPPGPQGPPGIQGPIGPMGPSGVGSSGTSDDTFSRQLKVTRISPTQLAVAEGNVSIGGVSFHIPAGTIGVSAGTGVIRLGITTGATPYGQVYAQPGITATCTGMGGCTAVIPSAQFGEGDLQMMAWTVTNGALDLNGYSDLRAPLGTGASIVPGAGMLVVPLGHRTQIGVNPDVVPVQ